MLNKGIVFFLFVFLRYSYVYPTSQTPLQKICSILNRCKSKGPVCTFRYGMEAVLMASTVKSERAKPTKYVCSGRRPSLNNHLHRSTETFGSLHPTSFHRLFYYVTVFHWRQRFTHHRVG